MAATRYTLTFEEGHSIHVTTDWKADEKDTVVMGDHLVTVYSSGGEATTYPWRRILSVHACPVP